MNTISTGALNKHAATHPKIRVGFGGWGCVGWGVLFVGGKVSQPEWIAPRISSLLNKSESRVCWD